MTLRRYWPTIELRRNASTTTAISTTIQPRALPFQKVVSTNLGPTVAKKEAKIAYCGDMTNCLARQKTTRANNTPRIAPVIKIIVST